VLRFLLILGLLLPTSAFAELDIVDAWIKNLPPAVPVRAGYMTIHNPGATAVGIVSISSDAFASVEIHRSVTRDGMAQMDRVDSLSIAPGATVQLAPGGYHLMMMQPLQATRPGQEIEIVLHFADGSEQRLTMTVIK
jgi:hypothetical protein